MKNRLGLVWIASLILILAFIPLGLAKGSCTPTNFSVAIVRASEYDESNIPYGQQANFTKNEDFNNTQIWVSVKTNCSCKPNRGLIIYNKAKQINTNYAGSGKDGGEIYAFTLTTSHVSDGLFDYINVTCDDKTTYTLSGNFMYVKDEEPPSLVSAVPENNTIVSPNGTRVNVSFWDPSGFSSYFSVLVNGKGVQYTTTTSKYWTNISIPLTSDEDSWMNIDITIEDGQRNSGQYYLRYFLDTAPPKIGEPVITSPSPDNKYQWLPVNITFNVSNGLETHCVAELERDGDKPFVIINETKLPINGSMIFSKTLDNLSDGEYNMYITCTDEGNLTNSTQEKPMFTLDNTPPTVEKVSPKTNATNAKTTLEINATDATSGVNICFVYSNGNQGKMTYDSKTGTWKVDIPADPNTTVWYDVMCKDNAGHETWLNKTLLVDTQAPTTSDNAPSGWQNQDVTITLTCSDSGVGCDTTYYSINGSRWETGNTITITAEGNTSITYYSVDKLRNTESQKTIYVLIDKTSPELDVISPENKTYNSSLIMVNFTVTDNIDLKECTYTLDGKAYQIKCDENFTLDLTDGDHNLTLSAKDNANNTNSKTIHFNIDTQAPEINYSVTPSTTSILVNASFLDPHLNWTRITLAGTNQTCDNSTNTTNLSIMCNFTDLTENTNYTITLTARDTLNHTKTENITVKTLARPIANIDYHPHSRFIWVKIFDASLSYDPDGNITSYFWDFGDGTNSTNITVTHEYTHPGTYTVKLTVIDNDNLTTTAEVTVVISRHTGGGGGGRGGWSGGFGGGFSSGGATITKPNKGNWTFGNVLVDWELEKEGNKTSVKIKVIGKGMVKKYKIIEALPFGLTLNDVKVDPKPDKIENGKLVWFVSLGEGQSFSYEIEINKTIDDIEELKPLLSEVKQTHVATPVEIEEKKEQPANEVANQTNVEIPKKSPVTGRITMNESNLAIGVLAVTGIVLAYLVITILRRQSI